MNSWKPVSLVKAVGIAGVLAVVAWLRQSNPDHWVRILDDANLVFHEAGHPLFGLLGPTLGLYGGTLAGIGDVVNFFTRSGRSRPAAGYFDSGRT